MGPGQAKKLVHGKIGNSARPRATPLHFVALRAANAYEKEKPDGNLTTLLTTLIGAQRLVERSRCAAGEVSVEWLRQRHASLLGWMVLGGC